MYTPIWPQSQSKRVLMNALTPLPGQFLLSLYITFPVLGFHRNGIRQSMLLCVWLLSFRVISLRFIHIIIHTSSLLFFVAEECSIVWIHYYSFIHSHVERQLGFSIFSVLLLKCLWTFKALHCLWQGWKIIISCILPRCLTAYSGSIVDSWGIE